MFVIRLYRSDGMLLLTVQVQRNLAQVEMVKIEWIAFGVTVEYTIGYESAMTMRVGSCPENNFS